MTSEVEELRRERDKQKRMRLNALRKIDKMDDMIYDLMCALVDIRGQCGKVCDEYEICTHIACSSSHRAWELADQALKLLEE